MILLVCIFDSSLHFDHFAGQKVLESHFFVVIGVAIIYLPSDQFHIESIMRIWRANCLC